MKALLRLAIVIAMVFPCLSHAQFSVVSLASVNTQFETAQEKKPANDLLTMMQSAELKQIKLLKDINKTINHMIQYKSDMEQYGVIDYWATVNEVLNNQTGDCEDYAIVKQAFLEEAGIKSTRFAYASMGDGKIKHAVLLYPLLDGDWLVMDNLKDEVMRVGMRKDVSIMFVASPEDVKAKVGNFPGMQGLVRK